MAGVGLDDPLSGGPNSIESAVNQLLSEAMVTTAGKRNQRLQDVPLTVAWIPGEELEGTGAFTLCEAIQYFPGLECRRGAMRKVAVSARGLGSNYLSNRLLLLKDGRPLTDPWTGQFYADETTPLTNVKQVEVIRGPGSALYGSNAFSGVINIIERRLGPHPGGPDLRRGRPRAGRPGQHLPRADHGGRPHGPGRGAGQLLRLHLGRPAALQRRARQPRGHQRGLERPPGERQGEGEEPLAGRRLHRANLGRPGGQQTSTVGNCGRCHYTPNDDEHIENLNATAQFDTQVTDSVRVFAQGYTLFKRRKIDLKNMVTEELQPTLGKRRRFGGEVRALLTLDELNVTFGGDVKDDLVNNQNVLTGLTSDDTQADHPRRLRRR